MCHFKNAWHFIRYWDAGSAKRTACSYSHSLSYFFEDDNLVAYRGFVLLYCSDVQICRLSFVISVEMNLCSSFFYLHSRLPRTWCNVAFCLYLVLNCMPQPSYWEQQWVRICRLLLGIPPPIRRGGRRRRANISMSSTCESLALVDVIAVYGIPRPNLRECIRREIAFFMNDREDTSESSNISPHTSLIFGSSIVAKEWLQYI